MHDVMKYIPGYHCVYYRALAAGVSRALGERSSVPHVYSMLLKTHYENVIIPEMMHGKDGAK
jgi:hypothetical protein